MQTLEGLFAPVVTPFTDDASSVSEIRFARQLRYLLEEQVDGFVIATDCGEFPTLSNSERKQLVEWCARMASGRPIIVNVSSLSTSLSLDLAQHAARHGARAVVLMPPYYGTYTTEEHITFIRTIAHYSNLPVVVVDPLESVTTEIVKGLHDMPDLVFATGLHSASRRELSCYKGLSTSDEFCAGNCVCSPLALLRPRLVEAALRGEEVDLAKLIILEETMGRMRVSKAGLEVLGLEMGPPRPPIKPLVGSVTGALRTLLSS